MRGGKRFGAGRKKGSTSKSTEAKRKLGVENLPDAVENVLWAKYLNHKDQKIAWEAFKLAKMYKSGQPPRAPSDKGDGQTIVIQFKRDPETPSVQTPQKPQL